MKKEERKKEEKKKKERKKERKKEERKKKERKISVHFGPVSKQPNSLIEIIYVAMEDIIVTEK